MRYKYFTIGCFILAMNPCFGQRVITAKIIDNDTKIPIDSALISIEGDSAQSISNHLGYFQLTVSDDDYLIIERDAYETSKLQVPSQNNFLIKIKQAPINEGDSIVNEYAKGKIINGNKVGVWEYYDRPDELSLKFNYDTDELLFVQPGANMSVVQVDEEFVAMKVDRPARYIGSLSELSLFVSKNVRYPNAARANSTVGTLYVQFVVDSLGKATNFSLINDIGDGCGEEVIRVLNRISNSWTAAVLDGKTFNSRFLIPVTFRIKLNGKELKPRRRRKQLEIPMSQHLDEVTILAIGISRKPKYLGPLKIPDN